MTDSFKITSDQKQVLFRKVSEIIGARHIQSLLDIGASQGFLAAALAQETKRYVAVESDQQRAAVLRAQGISVIEGVFPNVHIQGVYDLVLTSHSVPESAELYEMFFTKAWELVAPDGLLLVITFKGAQDDLFTLSRYFDKSWGDDDWLKLNEMHQVLSRFGSVSTEKITSHSYADNVADIADMLTIAIGGTSAEKAARRSELERIVGTKYKNESGYVFPHEHLVLSVEKKQKELV